MHNRKQPAVCSHLLQTQACTWAQVEQSPDEVPALCRRKPTALACSHPNQPPPQHPWLVPTTTSNAGHLERSTHFSPGKRSEKVHVSLKGRQERQGGVPGASSELKPAWWSYHLSWCPVKPSPSLTSPSCSVQIKCFPPMWRMSPDHSPLQWMTLPCALVFDCSFSRPELGFGGGDEVGVFTWRQARLEDRSMAHKVQHAVRLALFEGQLTSHHGIEDDASGDKGSSGCCPSPALHRSCMQRVPSGWHSQAP